MSGIQYLQQLLNDPTVEAARRDRAAAILSSYEFRAGAMPVEGTRAREQREAQTATFGTSWERFFHDHPAGDPPLSPQPQPPLRPVATPVRDTTDWSRYLNDDPPAPRHKYPEPPDDE